MNDYFLLSSKGIWSIDNQDKIVQVFRGTLNDPSAPRNYTVIQNDDEILLLSNQILLTKSQGFYWLKDAYWSSDQKVWTIEDVLKVTADGQIFTKEYVWTHWHQDPKRF
jgi:hypothetical protein